MRFTEFSRYTSLLIPTESEKVRKFIKGLIFCVGLVGRGGRVRDFVSWAAKISWKIEHFSIQGSEENEAKRARRGNRFIGTKPRSRGRHGRGHTCILSIQHNSVLVALQFNHYSVHSQCRVHTVLFPFGVLPLDIWTIRGGPRVGCVIQLLVVF